MLVELSFITAFLMIVISQSLLAAAMLFFRNTNRLSNRILAVLILILALWLTDHLMRIAGVYHNDPDLYFLPIFYSLAFGPLLWFYVISLVNADWRPGWKQLPHFIPVIIQAGLYFILTLSPYQVKYWFWENIHKPFTYHLEFDATWLSMVIYLFFAFRKVISYQKWLSENYSETSRIRLNWLKLILLAIIIVCIQWLVELVLHDAFGLYFSYDYSVHLLGLLVLLLGVGGMRQSSLAYVKYQPVVREEYTQNFQPDPSILRKLNEAMDENRLYLNPTLTLMEFSSTLKLSPRLVSRNINAGFGISFNEYVNRYRVEEIKRRLNAGDLNKFTLVGIAQQSGFNSKTSFNRIFKDLEGIRPSDYLKRFQIP